MRVKRVSQEPKGTAAIYETRLQLLVKILKVHRPNDGQEKKGGGKSVLVGSDLSAEQSHGTCHYIHLLAMYETQQVYNAMLLYVCLFISARKELYELALMYTIHALC